MRLWHYKLIPVLPNQMLVSQWRECIAIKRQWEKGTLKHRLVSYVMDYDKSYFFNYVVDVVGEMIKRDININRKFYIELYEFCNNAKGICEHNLYPEHNERYLIQCYHNLEEKYDRGIVSLDEIIKIRGVVSDKYE